MGNKSKKTELRKNLWKATKNEAMIMVQTISDDGLGKPFENFQIPLSAQYPAVLKTGPLNKSENQAFYNQSEIAK